MAVAEGRRRSLVIGVAGGSGSGKSTVAHSLVKAFDERTAVVIDCDAYYRDFSHLSASERSLVNWDHPDSLDLERLAADLAELAVGKAISKPRYDFVTHRRREEVDHIAPRKVIVAEGILLFTDERVPRSVRHKGVRRCRCRSASDPAPSPWHAGARAAPRGDSAPIPYDGAPNAPRVRGAWQEVRGRNRAPRWT